jgi:hypothetical protein
MVAGLFHLEIPMKKKPAQRYDDEWRAQVHAEALAALARARSRDAAARAARDEAKAARQRDQISGLEVRRDRDGAPRIVTGNIKEVRP